MYQKKVKPLWLILGALLFACGMAAGALWDLPLDKAIYSPQNTWAIWMECFGWYPLYLPVALLLAFVAADKTAKRAGRIAAGVGAAVGSVALAYVSLTQLEHRAVNLPILWCVGVWLVLLVGLVLLLRADLPVARMKFVFGWAAVYSVINLALTNVLKLIWARTRFDDMLAQGSFDDFTSWLHPFGNGGSSFPSGHTAAACGIFMLVLLCDVFPKWAARRGLVWGVCWAYVASMAAARLLIGRHYLSDTMAAAFLMAALMLVVTRTKWYRASLHRLYNRCGMREAAQSLPDAH